MVLSGALRAWHEMASTVASPRPVIGATDLEVSVTKIALLSRAYTKTSLPAGTDVQRLVRNLYVLLDRFRSCATLDRLYIRSIFKRNRDLQT